MPLNHRWKAEKYFICIKFHALIRCNSSKMVDTRLEYCSICRFSSKKNFQIFSKQLILTRQWWNKMILENRKDNWTKNWPLRDTTHHWVPITPDSSDENFGQSPKGAARNTQEIWFPQQKAMIHLIKCHGEIEEDEMCNSALIIPFSNVFIG